MKLNEHIVKLTLDELSDQISPADKAYLHQQIAKDSEAKQSWEDTVRWYQSIDTQEAVKQLPEKYTAATIIKKSVEKRKRLVLLNASSAAAVIIAIMSILWFPEKSGVEKNERMIAFSSAPYGKYGKHIRLQLAGKAVVLEEGAERVSVDGVTLKAKDRELEYSSTDHKRADWASLHIPAGKDYKITLADGTEVWLNSASSLHFPLSFTGDKREIRIEGEAYVKVAQNAHAPFILHLPGSAVQVLGTAFNVNTYSAGRETVSLVDGKVKVVTARDSVVLTPGYQAAVASDGLVQKGAFNQDETLSWRGGEFIFSDATIKEVSQVLPRWFGVTVILDRAIENTAFTGVINRNKPISQSLDILEATNGLKYSIKGDTVYLSPTKAYMEK
ncbi:FecR family protein [Chitinophaga cymbidii]|uniref:Iron dicitrate transporter FecR n=1 Tax=Chitinophaga cymbidii TaxID=1096750 RepID=A0A512RJ50_9BACT|nr:FecR domain-containing protein [Chitinophaga cymbidii]GEP95718.1 iron dicitrate transporter FecR [Chitinophaga cymbidii]